METNDSRVVLAVVVSLGVLALAALTGATILAFTGKTDSAKELIPIVTFAAGAVAGLLANPKSVNVQGLQDLADSHDAAYDSGVADTKAQIDVLTPSTETGHVDTIGDLDEDHDVFVERPDWYQRFMEGLRDVNATS